MSYTLEQLVGQLIIAGFRGKIIEPKSPIVEYIKDFNLAGVILYDIDLEIGGEKLTPGTRNIESPVQVQELITQLQKIAKNQLLISIDQEGGLSSRLKSIYGFQEDTSWGHIGKLDSEILTKQFSISMADTLSKAGVNLNFAPVLDLDYGKGTVISDQERALSSNPDDIIKHAKIFINAHREKNIITCGKHFPGLGSASGDTHEGLTNITETWTIKDIIPFDKLIQNNDLDSVMVSHAFDKKLDPQYPASLSTKIIQEILIKDLGFKGLIICDDPSMRAISDHYSMEQTFELMLNGGVDLFCLGNNLIYDPEYIPKAIRTICKLINSGKIKKNRIIESINKINSLKSFYGIHK